MAGNKPAFSLGTDQDVQDRHQNIVQAEKDKEMLSNSAETNEQLDKIYTPISQQAHNSVLMHSQMKKQGREQKESNDNIIKFTRKSESNSKKLIDSVSKSMESNQNELLKVVSRIGQASNKPDVFAEKKRLEDSILGKKDPSIPILTAMNKNIEMLIGIMKEHRDKPQESNKGGLLDGLGSIGSILAKYIPLILTLAAALPTEATALAAATKLIPTAIKLANPVVQAVKAGVTALPAARDMAGLARAGLAARTAGTNAAAGGMRNVFVGEQKMGTLGKIGAVAGAGATLARAAEGDNVGATAQGISTLLPIILGKTKLGKIANLASAGIDSGLLVRDMIKGKDKKEEEQLSAAEQAKAPENQIANNTAETNKLLEKIANGDASGFFSGFFNEKGEPPRSENTMLSPGVIVAGVGAAALALLTRGTGLGSILPAASGVTSRLGGLFSGIGGAGVAARPGAITSILGAATPTMLPTLGAAGRGAAGAAGAGAGAAGAAGAAGRGAAGAAGAAGAGAAGKKLAGRLIPGVGLVLGVSSGISRIGDGDYMGAALDIGAGAATLIPGVGTALALGLTGASITRDIVKATGSEGKVPGAVTPDKFGIETIAKTANSAAETLTGTVDKSAKSITDNTINSGKNIESSSKTASTQMSTTSKLLSTAGASLKTNVEKMFGNVKGSLLDTIAKFGALGVIGAAGAAGAGLVNNIVGNADAKQLNTASGQGGVVDAKQLRAKLEQGDITGLDLGAVSEVFESGGRGVSTVSGGQGDKGGVSYGKHQLSSKSGTMDEFLKSKYGEKYRGQFGQHKAGSDGFNAIYKNIASTDGTQFAKDQKAFIDVTHFGVQANAIKKRTGIDFQKRGRAITELIYSMAAQYRNLTPGIFEKALGPNANQLTDQQIIEKVMDYRAKNVQSHFKNNDQKTINGVASRIQTEKGMLLNINSKNTGSLVTASGNETQGGKTGGTGLTAKTPAKTATAPSTPGQSSSAKNADYDLDKICDYAFKKAGPKSKRKCALKVREALQQGDNKKQIKGGLGDANEWGKRLPTIGFVPISGKAAQKGDIAWFPPYPGSKEGHVCINTGAQWVSDFRQLSVQPSNTKNLPYTLFRAKSGFSNGRAVGVGAGGEIEATSDTTTTSTGGAEGSETITPDSIITDALKLASTGIAAVFNSDSMKSVVDFMRSGPDEYDDKYDIKAAGEFTKNIDEFDPSRVLKSHGMNGEADILTGVYGPDAVQRQQRNGKYQDHLDKLGGPNDIQRQQRNDRYDIHKKILGGGSNILRQLGRGGSGSWWMTLLESLLSGGLSRLNGMITGGNTGIEGAFGGFGGGFGGGLKSNQVITPGNGDMSGLPNVPGVDGTFGGGFGGGLKSNQDITPGNGIGDMSGLPNIPSIDDGNQGDIAYGFDPDIGGEGAFNGGFGGGVRYNSKDYYDEEQMFNGAKSQYDRDEEQKYKTEVNLPPPTPNPPSQAGGKQGASTQAGLDNPMLIRNPDSIIRAVAISLLGRSVK